MASDSSMELTGIGLYTISEAAKLTKAEPREIRRWVHGYGFRGRDGAPHSSPPLWIPQVDSPTAIGFRDLLELKLVKEFVSRGVHLSVVRSTIAKARMWFGNDYPLTTQRFLTDGRRVFHEAMGEDDALTDVAAQQRVIDAVIRPALYAGIDFLPDGRARRWFPERNRRVVLDPQISFGAPTLTDLGIRTDTIAAALKAEKSIARVAAQFNIPPAAVTAAANFERRNAA